MATVKGTSGADRPPRPAAATKGGRCFTAEDLDACWKHYKEYLVDILNGEYNLKDARNDLSGLIGSEFDLRTPKTETNDTQRSD